MSAARTSLLEEVKGLEIAVSSSRIGEASGLAVGPDVRVLRRGATITGLIVLENFVRDRTAEILERLRDWPAQYEDLPKGFRDRATIEALPHIEKFAKMLRRQNGDYETEILAEVGRMASMRLQAFGFTRFVAGDYTGNISDVAAVDLLKSFQVKDCWKSMQSLSRDVGFGVPSVKEVFNEMVRNRHRSAHVARYIPNADEVVGLPDKVRLIAICIDAALSASVEVAVNDWRRWVAEDFDWRSRLEIYLVVPIGLKYRVIKKGARQARRIVEVAADAKGCLPRKVRGVTRLLVEQAKDGRPRAWDTG